MPKRESAANQSLLKRIVSGGQTGVDRAALDIAIELGIEHGGWCPKGRIAEDGRIPAIYQLRETDAAEYSVRTARNVIDSDGTLILYQVKLQGGTQLTNRLAKQHSKPLLCVRLDHPLDIHGIQKWLAEQEIRSLNVAGPRESSRPGIHATAADALRRILTQPVVRLF